MNDQIRNKKAMLTMSGNNGLNRETWFTRRAEDIEVERSKKAHATWLSFARGADQIEGGEGQDALTGGDREDRLSSGRAKISGRPGLPAAVAAAVNTIAAAPDTYADLRVKGVVGFLRRGRGAGVDAHLEEPLQADAGGVLDAPTRRKEVSFSRVRGKPGIGSFASFPRRVRFFNTDKGELMVEIEPGLIWRIPILPDVSIEAGQHTVR